MWIEITANQNLPDLLRATTMVYIVEQMIGGYSTFFSHQEPEGWIEERLASYPEISQEDKDTMMQLCIQGIQDTRKLAK